MHGETIGIGESIKVTVIKAGAEFSLLPVILIFSFLFFMFLCYKAWKGQSDRRNSIV